MRGVTSRNKRRPKSKHLLGAAAIDLARQALEEMDEGTVGDHMGVVLGEDNVASHHFEAHLPGYRGWHWVAVLAAAPGSEHLTVSELALLPGDRALQAPDWVPYEDRIRPGDLGPGDLMPPAPDDPRLAPNPDNPDADPAEPGKVLTAAGRKAAMKRWRLGDTGPDAPISKTAEPRCRTCAFQVPIDGEVGEQFGVCTNEYSADGQVVALTYGCGAHADTPQPEVDPYAPPQRFDQMLDYSD